MELNVVEAGSRKGRKRHLIDADKYTRVSRSKALCGKPGKEMIRFDAVYVNYPALYPKKCALCWAEEAKMKRRLRKNNG